MSFPDKSEKTRIWRSGSENVAKDDSLGESVKQAGVDFDWKRIRFLPVKNGMNSSHFFKLIKVGRTFV